MQGPPARILDKGNPGPVSSKKSGRTPWFFLNGFPRKIKMIQEFPWISPINQKCQCISPINQWQTDVLPNRSACRTDFCQRCLENVIPWCGPSLRLVIDTKPRWTEEVPVCFHSLSGLYMFVFFSVQQNTNVLTLDENWWEFFQVVHHGFIPYLAANRLSSCLQCQTSAAFQPMTKLAVQVSGPMKIASNPNKKISSEIPMKCPIPISSTRNHGFTRDQDTC